MDCRSRVANLHAQLIEPVANAVRHVAVRDDQVDARQREGFGGGADVKFARIRHEDDTPGHANQVALGPCDVLGDIDDIEGLIDRVGADKSLVGDEAADRLVGIRTIVLTVLGNTRPPIMCTSSPGRYIRCWAMFIAVVATTTLLTGGICMATCSSVEPLSKTIDWLSMICRAAIWAMRRFASKLRRMRSSKAAAGESDGKAIAPPCVLISCFLASMISRSERIVTSETSKNLRQLAGACLADPLKFQHDLLSPCSASICDPGLLLFDRHCRLLKFEAGLLKTKARCLILRLRL